MLSRTRSVEEKLALLGGEPVRTRSFPTWPILERNDRKACREVLESKRWSRLGGLYVKEFEKRWAQRLGARYGLATDNGTSALFTALKALDIGPGDEVIVPPYTFVATINVVLLLYALPVFVDTERETFQIDARKIEDAITARTRAVLPVHLGGSAADMDTILNVARTRKIAVVEDACQAHLAEWGHQKVGTLGDLGCFSFQASKNLNSAEGGAIVTQQAELMRVCMSFHNHGRPYSLDPDQNIIPDPNSHFSYPRNGDNCRLTEFQGALLLEQLTRLERQTRTREQNAQYLTRQLAEIPGITPARMYGGCTRNVYHLYLFRYHSADFAGLSRPRFLEALRAEGIPCSPGYSPLNKEPFLNATLESRGFRLLYTQPELAALRERNRCPENDKLCAEAVWLYQALLLGTRNDMDQIAAAVRKIQRHASQLLRA